MVVQKLEGEKPDTSSFQENDADEEPPYRRRGAGLSSGSEGFSSELLDTVARTGFARHPAGLGRARVAMGVWCWA